MEEEKTPEKFVFQILVHNGCNDFVNKVMINDKGKIREFKI